MTEEKKWEFGDRRYRTYPWMGRWSWMCLVTSDGHHSAEEAEKSAHDDAMRSKLRVSQRGVLHSPDCMVDSVNGVEVIGTHQISDSNSKELENVKKAVLALRDALQAARYDLTSIFLQKLDTHED